MNFSIVFPTRERVELLMACLTSIRDNTADLSNIEVLIAVDHDDRVTENVLSVVQRNFPFVKVTRTNQARNFSTEYYNPLAMSSTGRYVQLLNDDTTFITPGWDTLALEVLESFQRQHPDGILLGRPWDNTACNYACFPVLSREAIAALGFAQNPGYTSWGSDIHLHHVFEDNGREVPLPYKINHHCCHNKTRERDRVSMRMGRLTKQPDNQIAVDTKRLKVILNETTPE